MAKTSDAITVREYWDSQLKYLEKNRSVVASDSEIATESGNDQRGTVLATLTFHLLSIRMEVFELVEVTDRPHRLKYPYHLQTGDEYWRAHYEPAYPAAIRYHLDSVERKHIPFRRVTLSEFVTMCWIRIDEQAQLDER